ncbi:hypothetical protein CONPUDRAFT_80215 [Coniophora puteana RWD-64-598 SS2]|uniref:F-box domain-containing protein n=1 Tax=Coniophora puteana (strain RWD-64-598) TaxID=741705 RepID=A0A5M3N451_CONPW|nr:uncharacterized protein CONPUDRAFT_80215 [Coniophora puteana RWD-64-598 SS2]EIW85814.1 hypothetical protein CONPUDRAFT_80215 [Coniophora puteana RWD-64-598 SS2]
MLPSAHSTLNSPLFPSCSIQSLASETLLEIFDYLYKDAKRALKEDTYNASSLFPFGVASVCRGWLDVSILRSRYWVNAVIPLDFIILPPVMATYLAMFENQASPDAHVVFCDVAPIDPRTENARLDGVMRLLVPHLHKCKSIVLDTHHRSSIVLATRHLDTLVVRPLAKLALVSTISDTTQDAHFTSFACPDLAFLFVDAKTFVNFVASEGPKGNAKDFAGELNITMYHPDSSSGPVELKPSELLKAIFELDSVHDFGWLSSLTIEGVTFDAEAVEYDDDDIAEILPDLHHVEDVYLTDIHSPFLRSFFISFQPDFESGQERTVSLTRCSSDEPFEICNTGILELHEIGDGMHVMTAVKHWDGLELRVADSPGFHDAVLNTMTLEQLCPILSMLDVKNCPLSVRSLKRFVAAREGDIERLRVSKGPELSIEDKLVLKESIPHGVIWNRERLY